MADHPPHLKPGIARVAFEGTLGSATWANVMHFRLTEAGPFGMADINTVADDLAAKYAAKLHGPGVTSASHFNITKLVYRALDDISTYRTTRVVDYNGGGGSPSAPAQVAYLINWNSEDGRRGGKPRTYICGVPAANVINDTDVDAGAQASLSALSNGFLGDIVGIGTSQLTVAALVDYSQRNAGTWRDTAATFEIYNGTCSPYVATIRNRVDRRRG